MNVTASVLIKRIELSKIYTKKQDGPITNKLEECVMKNYRSKSNFIG